MSQKLSAASSSRQAEKYVDVVHSTAGSKPKTHKESLHERTNLVGPQRVAIEFAMNFTTPSHDQHRIPKLGESSAFEVFQRLFPELCQLGSRRRPKKGKIGQPEFNKLLSSECDFKVVRSRKKSTARDARPWYYYGRRWLNPANNDDRRTLDQALQFLSLHNIEYARLNRANLYDIIADSYRKWSLHMEEYHSSTRNSPSLGSTPLDLSSPFSESDHGTSRQDSRKHRTSQPSEKSASWSTEAEYRQETPPEFYCMSLWQSGEPAGTTCTRRSGTIKPPYLGNDAHASQPGMSASVLAPRDGGENFQLEFSLQPQARRSSARELRALPPGIDATTYRPASQRRNPGESRFDHDLRLDQGPDHGFRLGLSESSPRDRHGSSSGHSRDGGHAESSAAGHGGYYGGEGNHERMRTAGKRRHPADGPNDASGKRASPTDTPTVGRAYYLHQSDDEHRTGTSQPSSVRRTGRPGPVTRTASATLPYLGGPGRRADEPAIQVKEPAIQPKEPAIQATNAPSRSGGRSGNDERESTGSIAESDTSSSDSAQGPQPQRPGWDLPKGPRGGTGVTRAVGAAAAARNKKRLNAGQRVERSLHKMGLRSGSGDGKGGMDEKEWNEKEIEEFARSASASGD